MKRLCIDGNSILNRAFYGIKLLTTKDGRYTNAIYGFMNIFIKLLDEVKPDEVAIAFDLRGKTFRHGMYDKYKANRKGMPAELAEQLPATKELLSALGYAVVTCEGYEGDDIIGTLAKNCDGECFIATGDRDSLQLIGGGVRVMLTTTRFGRGETVLVDSDKVIADYGVSPAQLIDVKALMGDASDNIPGVAGVGEKTALALIARFGSLDGVYDNIDSPDIKDGVRAKLRADRDTAYLSRRLAEINTSAPVTVPDGGWTKKEGDPARAHELLEQLEMYSTISRLGLSPSETKSPEQAAEEAVFAQPLRESVLNSLGVLAVVPAEQGWAASDGKRAFRLERRSLLMLLESSVKKAVYDAKAMYSLCLDAGVTPQNVIFDLKLAAYLLNPLSSDYSISRLRGEYRAGAAFDCEEMPEANGIFELYEKFKYKLEDQGMDGLLSDIELPLSLVLAKMENRGFLLDTVAIKSFGEELDAQLDAELQTIYSMVGREFNLNSPKQLGEALFVELKLPSIKKTKSGFSTDRETLEKLRGSHPVIDHILQWRVYEKLNSTYVKGLLSAAGPDNRVHTEFIQTETRTGRISSANPNLQNIPVRTELGSRLRKYFIAEPGRVLLDADYSQIELRVLAHISDDRRMIEAFLSGDDIHAITASQIFKLPLSEVDSQMRRRAKAVNFGIVYGIGAFSLANDVGVSIAEADNYIKNYLATYGGVAAYLENTVAKARGDGFVSTMYGRRRALPELANSNKAVQALGRRLAMNTPIQGAAADIIKIAMIRVENRLAAEGLDAKLILQIHDELIVSAADSCAERAAEVLREEMEGAATLKAPLIAEVKKGHSWYDAKD